VGRVYNRTPDVQTFLWWANVATRAHEQYQTFFPPDARYVADHAKRATATYPLCEGHYYGVDYGSRKTTGIPLSEQPRQFVPPHAQAGTTGLKPGVKYAPNDLSWYANIPVPTSYMCMGSQDDFAGGYDHKARAGLIQIANHHISPGKKQWTWGNHEFGYAWDRNLTERDRHGEYPPYIELMSGVYTDNQPDFSYLQPGETKTWSQFWYPIRQIGPAHQATIDAAISLQVSGKTIRLGVAVTAVQPAAIVRLEHAGKLLRQWTQTLAPDDPLTTELPLLRPAASKSFRLRVLTREGREIVSYQPAEIRHESPPAPATKPPTPSRVASGDELYLIGLHLEQYRHATLSPEIYWREALRRDPADSRCNLALGRWHLRRGELSYAETHLRASLARLTSRNPNPSDGEAYYQLGLCLRQQALFSTDPSGKLADAYATFYKATWNHAWQSAGCHALAEIDSLRADWVAALDHLNQSLRLNADHLRARDLKVVVLRQLGQRSEAATLLRETLALDPLDWWARFLNGEPLACDTQVRLDLALDCARAGLFRDALSILADAPSQTPARESKPGAPAMNLPDASLGTAPLVHYYRAWLAHALNDPRAEHRHLAAAAKAPADYCFPARLEEIAIFQQAMAANPRDAKAPFYLGNLLYDRRRHREAIPCWERAVKLDARNAVAWRNLGIGYFNILQQPAAARHAYQKAFHANPRDARLLYERDQLWKRLGESPIKRLRELVRHLKLAETRDDLAVELCALFNQTGQPAKALDVLKRRRFQPWEGGEGQALAQHVRTHLALGRAALRRRDYTASIARFQEALQAPENLGEAKHLLASQGDIHFWLGCAREAAGDVVTARRHWEITAAFNGDFQAMAVSSFSEMTYYSASAMEKLGQKTKSRRLLKDLLAHARSLARALADIDYFATSLPTMLLFNDDLQARQTTTARFLEAQARLGLGQNPAARKLLRDVLRRDPHHALAADLLQP
jgi:tetratricopeptide (TPR) repeat protein